MATDRKATHSKKMTCSFSSFGSTRGFLTAASSCVLDRQLLRSTSGRIVLQPQARITQASVHVHLCYIFLAHYFQKCYLIIHHAFLFYHS